ISGENRELIAVADSAVVAFAPNSQDAAIADSSGVLVLFRDLAGAATSKVLSSSVPPPNGLAFSADGRSLFLASARSRSVTAFNLKSGGQTRAVCDCSPVSLVRMGNVFRMNELSHEPLWLLDAAASDPRIVFVPAAVD